MGYYLPDEPLGEECPCPDWQQKDCCPDEECPPVQKEPQVLLELEPQPQTLSGPPVQLELLEPQLVPRQPVPPALALEQPSLPQALVLHLEMLREVSSQPVE